MRRFKNILFVSHDKSDQLSIERAVKLAVKNKAKLTLVDVVEKPPSWAGYRSERLDWDKLHRADIADRTQRLEQAADPHSDKLDIVTKVLEGKKFLETIREVLRHKHDLVIKEASSQQGVTRRIFATEDMRLLRKCPCPVLLTKHGFKSDFQNIIATVDFDSRTDMDSPTANNTLNTQIMDMAISLANEEKSNLNVVHVYQIAEEGLLTGGIMSLSKSEIAQYYEEARKDYESVVAKLLSRAKRRLGDAVYNSVNIHINAIKGDPAQIIPGHAKKLNADLVVMGTVARTGVAGFIIGNTAETILNDVECSILALKPDGFVSPVTLV